MEVSGQLHVPTALPPGKEPLGLRAALDDVVERKNPSFCHSLFNTNKHG